MNHATTLRPHSSRFVLALACLWLGACATVPKTEAPPRIAHAELAIAADHRLGYRVAWPARGSKLPLVLFSHGAYSSGDAYDPILDAWAAHGYVVISVTHRDSVSLGVKRGTNEPRYFAWRLDDMQAVLAALPTVLRNADPAGDLLRRSDLTRIAATGHSFGGLVAQTEGGATYFDAGAGTTRSRFDPRVRAVIIMSGAGPFPPTLRPSDFATLRVPTLVTVGTEDLAQAPGMSGWEWRRLPYELAAPGDKYRLTIRGADHYLGGSVGRDDLPRSPQAPEFQRLFNDVSLQFLDAHLRGDRTAQRALRTRAGDGVARDIDARATLERR
ncbi:MAG: hypothetical protein RL603_735 [Pseudomonadota bacterium]|jgi:dienelactone hydrolase